ncbi:MAG: hypothetical protein EBT26_10005, partial [Microbacteriaceae bacterium]|nr:hypothetical protein [Microbacteriaceae bacterium]
MNLLSLTLIAVLALTGCTRLTVSSPKTWCLLEAKEWLPLVRNERDTESKMQSAVAIAMQQAGMWEEAMTVAEMIEDYRRAIVLGQIGQEAVVHNQRGVADKALELGENSLSRGVGEFRELGLIELMDLANR